MNNFKLIENEDRFNVSIFNPDTKDFTDGFLKLSVELPYECKITYFEYNNGNSGKLKASINDDVVYLESLDGVYNGGDILNLKYFIQEDSPLDINGSVVITIESLSGFEVDITINSIEMQKKRTFGTLSLQLGDVFDNLSIWYANQDLNMYASNDENKPYELSDAVLNPNKGFDIFPDLPIVEYGETEIGLNNYDEFYINNIILSENNIVVGDLTSDTEMDIYIYNSFSTDKTISSLDLVDVYDIELSVENENVRMYRSTLLNILIKKDGEIDNDGYIKINFTDGSFVNLYLSYSRQNLFDLLPNETATTQTFTFNTEIMKSISNKESRINLTPRPFTSIDVLYEVDGVNRMKLENLLISTGDSKFNMPVYNLGFEARIENNKLYGSFKHCNIKVNDNVYFYMKNGDRYIQKVLEIGDGFLVLNQENNIFDYCYAYPLIFTMFKKQNKSARFNGDYAEYNLSFDDMSNSQNMLNNLYDITFETIDGLPFYDFLLPNTSNPTDRTIERNFEELSNGISNVDIFYNNSKSLHNESFELQLADKFEISRIKKAFNDCLGRFGEFYVIKPDIQYKVSLSINKDLNVIYTNGVGNEGSFINNDYEYIMIETKYGERLIKKIDRVSQVQDGEVEILYLTTNFDREYLPSDLYGIYPLVKSRFDNDSLVIRYETSSIATTDIDIINIR